MVGRGAVARHLSAPGHHPHVGGPHYLDGLVVVDTKVVHGVHRSGCCGGIAGEGRGAGGSVAWHHLDEDAYPGSLGPQGVNVEQLGAVSIRDNRCGTEDSTVILAQNCSASI